LHHGEIVELLFIEAVAENMPAFTAPSIEIGLVAQIHHGPTRTFCTPS
jgi:hypothetical protein